MNNEGLQARRAFKVQMLSLGGIKAITYAANHPEIFERDQEAYSDVMDIFQDHIPYQLIDCNQWWFGHYWSSGRTCSKCREIAQMFPCNEPVSDQHFEAMTQRMTAGHDPSCSAHNVHSFFGLKVCVTRMNPHNKTTHPITHSPINKQTGEQP